MDEHSSTPRRSIPILGSFSAGQTLDCGQCFRWSQTDDGRWLGIVRGVPALVSDENGQLIIESPDGTDELWRGYFDAELDYDEIRESFSIDAFTAAAADYGKGIRILNQDPWETLCSFIVSQCNNIPRIRGILTRLCERYGKPVEFQGHTLYSFPDAETLAVLERDDLEFLRSGYRAPYIISAARDVWDGTVDFDKLREMDTDRARREIMNLKGVGRKVADCFLLFGLHKLDAFPVDTWMKKAAAFYDGDFTAFQNSPYAGVYQQYIFYYARYNGLA